MSPATLPALALLSSLLGAPAPAAPPPATAPAAEAAQPADPTGCTGTLSGAVTATFGCSVTARIEGNLATVTITADGPVAGVRALKPGTVSLSVPVPSGTYSGEALKGAAASVETTAGATFTAGAGKGEVTLTVDQAERYRQAPNNLVMSGSLKARLLPARGGKGEVVVEVRF
jgi:hypothetical protein